MYMQRKKPQVLMEGRPQLKLQATPKLGKRQTEKSAERQHHHQRCTVGDAAAGCLLSVVLTYTQLRWPAVQTCPLCLNQQPALVSCLMWFIGMTTEHIQHDPPALPLLIATAAVGSWHNNMAVERIFDCKPCSTPSLLLKLTDQVLCTSMLACFVACLSVFASHTIMLNNR